MNFIEAVKQLENGRKVFRMVNVYDEEYECELEKTNYGDYTRTVCHKERPVTKEDILATNWQVFYPYTESPTFERICKDFFEYYKENSSFSKGFKKIELIEHVFGNNQFRRVDRFIDIRLSCGLKIRQIIDLASLEPILSGFLKFGKGCIVGSTFPEATYIMDKRLSELVLDFFKEGKEE